MLYRRATVTHCRITVSSPRCIATCRRIAVSRSSSYRRITPVVVSLNHARRCVTKSLSPSNRRITLVESLNLTRRRIAESHSSSYRRIPLVVVSLNHTRRRITVVSSYHFTSNHRIPMHKSPARPTGLPPASEKTRSDFGWRMASFYRNPGLSVCWRSLIGPSNFVAYSFFVGYSILSFIRILSLIRF